MQAITVTYLGAEGEDFYTSDDWEIRDGLVTVRLERATVVMPVGSIRSIRFEAE